jgi:small ligand-binding sensory domain FIST
VVAYELVTIASRSHCNQGADAVALIAAKVPVPVVLVVIVRIVGSSC